MRQSKIRVRRYKHRTLHFVVNFREAGKRKRSFFETETQAKSFAAFKNDERQRNGTEHSEFPTSLRIMAQECKDALSKYGKTIKEATEFFVRHLKASEKSCTAAQLVDELIAAKKADGVSVRYVRDLRSRLGIFAKKFDGQMVATITATQIDDWLRSLKLSPVTRNHYRGLIVVAFSYAMRHGYAAANPAVGGKAKEPKADIGILTVDQTARLLEASPSELLPFVAIGAFAGLRRAELERLDWSEIDFESGLIEVKAAKSKTAMHRFVTMQPNLREWLLPLRKHKGNVMCEEFRKQFNQTRTDAGIAKWPDNGLRHSFASYHMAHFKNAASTALELGHHDSRMTFAHYRQLVRPQDAERYWAIKPAATEKVVQLVTQR